MTANDFRVLALGCSGAVESAHMDHPDFRAGGKIFASLGYPEEGWGMVKLTPAQQQSYIRKAPEVFVPCKGEWGRGGATGVHLASARKDVLQAALKAAWQNVTAKTRIAIGKAEPRRGRVGTNSVESAAPLNSNSATNKPLR